MEQGPDEYADGWNDEDDKDCEDHPAKETPPAEIPEATRELGEISKQDKALTKEWHDQFWKLEDPGEMTDHLYSFIESRPDLVDHLELQHEVLFKIVETFGEKKRHEEAVELLEKIRSSYPETYKQSYGYYDFWIASYKLATGKKNEIPNFLNYFIEYPDHSPVRPKPDCTREDAEKLAQDFSALDIDIIGKYRSPEGIETLLAQYFAPLAPWKVDDCHTRKQLVAHYRDVAKTFSGYLVSRKGMRWISADFNIRKLYGYLFEVVPQDMRPRTPFVFAKKLIEETATTLSKGFVFVQSISYFGTLNAVYHFADYLVDAESISPIPDWPI